MNAEGQHNGHAYSIAPSTWGYHLTMDGIDRGHYDDYVLVERRLAWLVGEQGPHPRGGYPDGRNAGYCSDHGMMERRAQGWACRTPGCEHIYDDAG
jgi:hypothetical protein